MKLYDSKEYLVEQLKNKDYSQIAEENNISYNTISRRAKKYGLTKNIDKWTKRELNLLKANYIKNPCIYKLFPHRSKSSLNHKASRLNLRRKFHKTEYTVNEDFFKTWTSNMAYVFGWFCSDGNVASKSNCCQIHLHCKDEKILKKIKKAMKSNHPISNYKQSSTFRVYNENLRKDLIKLGCPPKKSLILKFPNIPKKYLSHFVRGFFDGDGSIHFNKPNTIKVAFITTKQFLDRLRQALHNHVGVNFGNLRQHHKIYILTYFGDNARKLCYWMYKDSGEFYLERKKERFKKHLLMRTKNGI